MSLKGPANCVGVEDVYSDTYDSFDDFPAEPYGFHTVIRMDPFDPNQMCRRFMIRNGGRSVESVKSFALSRRLAFLCKKD
jgi:hypothetical protein